MFLSLKSSICAPWSFCRQSLFPLNYLDYVTPRLSYFLLQLPIRLSSGVTITYLLGCDITAHGLVRCQNLALVLHGYISEAVNELIRWWWWNLEDNWPTLLPQQVLTRLEMHNDSHSEEKRWGRGQNKLNKDLISEVIWGGVDKKYFLVCWGMLTYKYFRLVG